MSLAAATMNPIQAYEELMRFASKFGVATLRLALHAAVPQSFRIDLLHLIKLNFVPEAKYQTTVEADLLLSPLCTDIGRGYFQFDAQVRSLLLDNLAETYVSEETPRIRRVAGFLLSYADHFNRLTSGSSDRLWREYLETQRWVALAFIDPESAARQFAECLQQAVEENDIVTRLQLGGLAASLSAPLAGYAHLLNYASALQTLETKGWDEAREKFGEFLGEEIKIGDITLRPASEIIYNPVETAPPAETAEEFEDEILSDDEPDSAADSYDVYISYARTDDDDKNNHWVSEFNTALTISLGQKLGRKARIWYDSSAKIDNRFGTLFQQNIRQAKTLIAILSPDYLKSKWTQEELKQFEKETAGGLTNDRPRIFKVIKDRVDVKAVPRIIRGTSDYDFSDVAMGWVSRTHNLDFEEQERVKLFLKLGQLSSEIAETLRVIDGEDQETENENDLPQNFFNVPYPSKGDISIKRGEKLREIRDKFTERTDSSIGRGVSIEGFPGLGKTQLAAEYAYRYRGEYPNGVYWLSPRLDLETQILEIAEKQDWLDQAVNASPQFAEAKARFLALSEVLIIFDDVKSYEEIQDYILEADLKTHLLITSTEDIPGFYSVKLELLDRPESRELLLKVSGRTEPGGAENEHLAEILEMLGDLPLAIETAGLYLAGQMDLSFAEYRRLWEEVSTESWETIFSGESFAEPNRILLRLLKISEKRFTEKPLAVEVLDILTWSSSSGMDISLLSELAAAEDPPELRSVLTEAVNAGVIKRETAAERYTPHRLLTKVRRAEDPLQNKKDWAEMIAGRLRKWFDTRIREFDPSDELEAEFAHLAEWQQQMVNINAAEAVHLLIMIARMNNRQDKYREAENALHEGLSLYESREVGKEGLLANIYYELGITLYDLAGYDEALNYQFRALETAESLGLQVETAGSFHQIGLILFAQGRYQEALTNQQRALEIQQSLGNRHSTAAILGDIALIFSMMSNFDEALKYQMQALQAFREIYGQEHPNYAAQLNTLGEIHIRQSKYPEATSDFENALQIYEKTIGRENPEYAGCLNNLARVYDVQGLIERAWELYEQALEINEKLLTEDDPQLKVDRERVARNRMMLENKNLPS